MNPTESAQPAHPYPIRSMGIQADNQDVFLTTIDGVDVYYGPKFREYPYLLVGAAGICLPVDAGELQLIPPELSPAIPFIQAHALLIQ